MAATTNNSATPGRWDPVTELETLHQRLGGYLDLWRNGPLAPLSEFRPPVDIEETTDAYLVEIELPGINKNDLTIQIADRRLNITGEREDKQRVGIMRRRERHIGTFAYEVTLPGNTTDHDPDITANLDRGILTIRVPKPEHERLRHIHIH